jgi:hypothetical protein
LALAILLFFLAILGLVLGRSWPPLGLSWRGVSAKSIPPGFLAPWPLGSGSSVFLFLRALPVAQTTMEQWNLTSGAPRTPKKPQAKPQDPGARGGLGGVVLSDKNKLCCSVVIAASRLGKA